MSYLKYYHVQLKSRKAENFSKPEEVIGMEFDLDYVAK